MTLGKRTDKGGLGLYPTSPPVRECANVASARNRAGSLCALTKGQVIDPYSKSPITIGRYSMTEKEAKAVRERWQRLANLVGCDHPNLELGRSEADRSMEHYHCTDCGDMFPVN
jgi:hypothetical protein